jgi:hypothetical protein
VAVEVCKPFADPRIGGVGTRQSVYRGKGLLSRVTEMFLDHRYFDENACQTYMGRAVSCLSGRTAVYRRAALLRIEHDFMNETFWGVQCLSGDDKRLTTLLLRLGYQTYLQRTARVWSTFPTRWREFVSQRLRWARNTWRSDLRALSQPWVWRHPFLAYTLIDKAVSCFTLLVGPIFMAYSLVHHHWLFAGVLALWWQISRSAKLLPHLRQRPSSFFIIPGYVVLSWVMALIKIRALLTIRKQRWLTRDVAIEGGAVVRTPATIPAADAGMPPVNHPWAPTAQSPAYAGMPPPGLPWLPGAVALLALIVSAAVLCPPSSAPRPVDVPVVTVADDDPQPTDPGSQDPGTQVPGGQDPGTQDPGGQGSDGNTDSNETSPKATDTDSSSDTTPSPEPAPDREQNASPDSDASSAAQRQAAKRAARARATAEHRARLASIRQQHRNAAAPSIDALWQRRGRPAQLVIVRAHNVDMVGGGHLIRRIARPGAPVVSVRDLSRLLPPDWLAVTDDGTAKLFAALEVGAGTTLDTGADVRRMSLAGSADPAKAASVWVGHARLSIHNVDVGSFDRDSSRDQPAGPVMAGRPFIVGGAGSTLDITDAVLHDLGTSPPATPTGPGARAAVGYGPGSTGSISRVELHANSVGIRLSGSHDVHLDTVTVTDSGRDGLMLHGDVNSTLRDVHAVHNGRNGVVVTGASTNRVITGITTLRNTLFGVAVLGQQHPVVADISGSEDRAGGLRLTNTTDAAVTNADLGDEPIGILINGAANRGSRVLGARITGGHDAIVIARGASAADLEGPTITGADHDAITSVGAGTRITGGSITDSRSGINVRAPAQMTGTTITGVTHGIHVGPGATLTAASVDVLATGSGLKVDPTATAAVTTSRIRARQSLRGVVILLGVNTISPAPFNWIGAFGVLFVMLALALEVIAASRRRRRAGPPPMSPIGPPPGYHPYPHPAVNGYLLPVGTPH